MMQEGIIGRKGWSELCHHIQVEELRMSRTVLKQILADMKQGEGESARDFVRRFCDIRNDVNLEDDTARDLLIRAINNRTLE